MMPQQRYHSLDFLRAVMMFLGVVLHGAQMYMAVLTTDDYYLDPMRSVSMDAILVVINTFRMPTFFLLSGFFVALLFQRRGLSGMLKNRWQRITLPFLILLPALGVIMTALTLLAASWLQTRQLAFDLSLIDNPIKLVDKTHNLWFLYYLTMFVALAALVIAITQKLPETLRGLLVNIGQFITPLNALILLALLLALIGSMSPAGRITASVVFMPSSLVFLYFGSCFVFGWLLFYRQHWLQNYQSKAWLLMAGACITLLISLACFALQGDKGGENYLIFHVLLSLFSGLSVMLFMVAFIGLFQRYFGEFNRRYRYLSDSAYWVFVSHSIFLVALAFPMAHLHWPAEAKFLIVTLGATLLCLLSYHHCVRNTVLGVLLNGRRYSGLPLDYASAHTAIEPFNR
ncbi:MAG: acyltransferase family protein [Cellvibrionaceae bacterium]